MASVLDSVTVEVESRHFRENDVFVLLPRRDVHLVETQVKLLQAVKVNLKSLSFLELLFNFTLG